MKKVLCFGDSNTYGFIPEAGFKRYNVDERWTSILKSIAPDFEIIEQGCCNRTAFTHGANDDEFVGEKCIHNYLKNDIDVLLLQLGINDLQFSYDVTLKDFEDNYSEFLSKIYNIKPNIELVLLAPSILTADIYKGYFKLLFNEQSIEKSTELPNIYERLAKKYSAHLIDLNNFVKVSKKDGLHYDIASHKIIAKVIKDYLYENFY